MGLFVVVTVQKAISVTNVIVLKSWSCCCVKSYYSGREAPSLKMGFVCFSFVCLFVCVLGGSTYGLMLIGWHAANMSSMSSGKEQNVGEQSVFCFPWLCLLFVRMLIHRCIRRLQQTHLNFNEHFWACVTQFQHCEASSPSFSQVQAAASYVHR